MNYLETSSLVASVLTLLAGQVFYNVTDDELTIEILTVLVITILALNLGVVIAVVYVDWRPKDDPHKDFDMVSSAAEAFRRNDSSTVSFGGSSLPIPVSQTHMSASNLGLSATPGDSMSAPLLAETHATYVHESISPEIVM